MYLCEGALPVSEASVEGLGFILQVLLAFFRQPRVMGRILAGHPASPDGFPPAICQGARETCRVWRTSWENSRRMHLSPFWNDSFLKGAFYIISSCFWILSIWILLKFHASSQSPKDRLWFLHQDNTKIFSEILIVFSSSRFKNGQPLEMIKEKTWSIWFATNNYILLVRICLFSMYLIFSEFERLTLHSKHWEFIKLNVNSVKIHEVLKLTFESGRTATRNVPNSIYAGAVPADIRAAVIIVDFAVSPVEP